MAKSEKPKQNAMPMQYACAAADNNLGAWQQGAVVDWTGDDAPPHNLIAIPHEIEQRPPALSWMRALERIRGGYTFNSPSADELKTLPHDERMGAMVVAYRERHGGKINPEFEADTLCPYFNDVLQRLRWDELLSTGRAAYNAEEKQRTLLAAITDIKKRCGIVYRSGDMQAFVDTVNDHCVRTHWQSGLLPLVPYLQENWTGQFDAPYWQSAQVQRADAAVPAAVAAPISDPPKRERAKRLTQLRKPAKDYQENHHKLSFPECYRLWVELIRPKTGAFIEGVDYPKYSAWRNWMTH